MKKVLWVVVIFILLGVSCKKDNTDNNLSELISSILIPTSTENNVEKTKAASSYKSIPPGVPIVVEVGKYPVSKDPIDRGPFVNMTRAVARLGFRGVADTMWGIWEYNDTTNRWIKIQSATDSIITMVWSFNDSTWSLCAHDFQLISGNLIRKVVFDLIQGNVTEAPGDTLATMNIDSIEYDADGNPIAAAYNYTIPGVINVRVNSTALSGHHLREEHIYGSVIGNVETNSGVIIHTDVENAADLNQDVTVSYQRKDVTYTKIVHIDAPLHEGNYTYRDISGRVYTESNGNQTEVGTLEGRIWHPEDASHKSYLDVILNTGERIHLWN